MIRRAAFETSNAALFFSEQLGSGHRQWFWCSLFHVRLRLNLHAFPRRTCQVLKFLFKPFARQRRLRRPQITEFETLKWGSWFRSFAATPFSTGSNNGCRRITGRTPCSWPFFARFPRVFESEQENDLDRRLRLFSHESSSPFGIETARSKVNSRTEGP